MGFAGGGGGGRNGKWHTIFMVATGQEIIREKIILGQVFESGQTDVLKSGKLKL